MFQLKLVKNVTIKIQFNTWKVYNFVWHFKENHLNVEQCTKIDVEINV